MSNQQSTFEPEHSSQQQQQERLYNDDPREQHTRQAYQESAAGDYEEGYRGYDAPYLGGEKLRPAPPPTLQGWKIILIVLIIALVASGSGAIGSLIGVLFGFLGVSFGLAVAAFVVLAVISTRPVSLPTRTFAVAEHAELSIHNDAGNVRILRGESHQVEVRGTRYVSRLFGEGGEVPIFFTQEGNSIGINVKHWSFMRFFNIGYVNLDIYVPASSDVQIQCNAGTLDISGISGRVEASTNAGTVMVASSQLADGSSLHTNAGTITVRQSTLDGGMRGHTNAGTITIVKSALKGNTTFTTNAGTITIVESALKGNTTFTTNAGTIHFDGSLAPDSDYLFKTNAGTIDTLLPADSSFVLNARTSLGSVHNDFRNNLVGQGPYARLNLDSQMGTISVRRK
jgi:hypothetical protein